MMIQTPISLIKGRVVCKTAIGIEYAQQATSVSEILGFVAVSTPANSSVEIVEKGVLDGFSGLTTGSPIYLSSNGVITQTVPTTGRLQRLGVAVSSTKVLIQIHSSLFLLSSQSAIQKMTIGANTHVGYGIEFPILDNWVQFKSYGLSSFRDELKWALIETTEGVYSASNSSLINTAYTTYREHTFSNPACIILDYGNALYEANPNGTAKQPSTTHAFEGYGNYAAWCASRFIGKNVVFELWNEWNGGMGSNTIPATPGSPIDYATLCSYAYTKMKLVDNSVFVIAGALADDVGWVWLTQSLNAGLLNSCDAISVHLYNYSMSQTSGGASEMMNRIASLSNLLKSYNNGNAFPIYITETGYPNTHVSEVIASEQNLRFILDCYSVPEVRGLWFYEYINSGTNPADRESTFGLINYDGSNKIVSLRLASVLPFLNGSSFVKKITNSTSSALLFKSDNSGAYLLVCWSGNGYVDTPKNIIINGTFATVSAFDVAVGDRVTSGLSSSNQTQINVTSNTYPTLMWLTGGVPDISTITLL